MALVVLSSCSKVRRFKPIMLTASAAVLAMVPLARTDFFGPQAITIFGGLLVATVLTILFVPALYAAWFRVERQTALGSGRAVAAVGLSSSETGRFRALASALAWRLSWKSARS